MKNVREKATTALVQISLTCHIIYTADKTLKESLVKTGQMETKIKIFTVLEQVDIKFPACPLYQNHTKLPPSWTTSGAGAAVLTRH